MVALIIGANGQDGKYLKKYLKNINYEVIELDIDYIKINNNYGITNINISNYNDVEKLIKIVCPDELYFLAAYHHSSEENINDEIEHLKKSYEVNFFSYHNFLDAIRKFSSKTKTFYAASCHIYGNCNTDIQDESTEARPNTIYALTKYDSMRITEYYRNKYKLFLTTGILYNHESHLRPIKFVSRKIVNTAVKIKNGEANKLEIGNLNSMIDWGFAGDFVKAYHKILSCDEPEDFIISSGSIYKIKDFIKYVFNYLELDWKSHVVENNKIIKRKFNGNLFGNNKKLFQKTGWKPEYNLEALAKFMVDKELEMIKKSIDY